MTRRGRALTCVAPNWKTSKHISLRDPKEAETMAKIRDVNEFPDVKALQRATKHEGILEIDGAGMDEGRVFLTAKDGWAFDRQHGVTEVVSVGSASDVTEALKHLKRREEIGKR